MLLPLMLQLLSLLSSLCSWEVTLSRVLLTRDEDRTGNWFIGSSLVVTTLNYYTIASLLNLQSIQEADHLPPVSAKV
jgi:hypothetical protein